MTAVLRHRHKPIETFPASNVQSAAPVGTEAVAVLVSYERTSS
jgi:hypothetical protein